MTVGDIAWTARDWRSAGQWPLDREIGSVTLDWDARHRRRIQLTTDQGQPLLLDLVGAVRLGEGDGLEVAGQGYVRVIAAVEDLLAIRAGSSDLARLAYHLGNRHLAVELRPDLLLIRADHVIADMIQRLGGAVTPVQQPFTPESGAYGANHALTGHQHA